MTTAAYYAEHKDELKRKRREWYKLLAPRKGERHV